MQRLAAIRTFEDDRLPPHNIDAEEAVLGGLLFDRDAMARIIDILPDASAFYVESHQLIYQAALDLHHSQQPTDLMMISSRLRDENRLERVGGLSAIASLVESIVSAANIDKYAELVREKALRRQIISASQRAIELAQNTRLHTDDVIDRVEQSMFQVSQSSQRAGQGLIPIRQTIQRTFNEIEQANQGLLIPGLPCGFYDLDAMIQGFEGGDLIIPAGRPSMGKTAFVNQIGYQFAEIHKLPVAIFSLEMSKERLVYRFLSQLTGLPAGSIRTGRIPDHEWENLGYAIDKLSNLPINIDDQPTITVSEIRSRSRKFAAENGGIGAIIIDYLQLIASDRSDNRVQELGTITRSLKSLARELNCPVFALSQLSRNVESRTNKRPMMSDLRESGSIEQDADLIMMLYREDYYDPCTSERGIAEVIVCKNRNGPVGTVKLLFDAQSTTFRNLAAPASRAA